MRGTDGPDDDSQQGPEHAHARPRADCSAVAMSDVADLEPTTDELERKRARTAPHSKDRQPRNWCQTCLKHESGKRARKLHRGKPADGRPHSAERLCTATSKREREDRIPHLVEASPSRKTVPQNSKACELQPACNAREKRQE